MKPRFVYGAIRILLLSGCFLFIPYIGATATWYSQGSGTWGINGTANLWNDDPNGMGAWRDGTDLLTGEDVVIQDGHQIILAGNLFNINSLVVENNAQLTPIAAPTSTYLLLSGNSPLQVSGTIDDTVNNNQILLNLSSNIPAISGGGTLKVFTLAINPFTALSIDVDIEVERLNLYRIPGTVNFSPITLKTDRTLHVTGDLVLDQEATFGSNLFNGSGILNIEGSLEIDGIFLLKTDNNANADFIITIHPSGSLKMRTGLVGSGGSTPTPGAGLVTLDVQGTLETLTNDMLVQPDPNRTIVRMNNGSKVILAGGGGQLLDADVANASYYDVELAGTGPKTLGGNITIENDLYLNSGIELGAFNLQMTKVHSGGFNFDSPFLGNPGSSNFINTNGSGSFTAYLPSGFFGATSFPVGNTSYSPVNMADNTFVGGVGEYFTFRVANTLLTNGNGGTAITEAAVNKTWFISEATPGGQNISMILYWQPADELNGFDPNNCWISHYISAAWDIDGPFISNGTNLRSINRANLTNFSPFSIQSLNILPVSLSSFTGKTNEEGHQLKWSTAWEENNRQFIIEHSTDGEVFPYHRLSKWTEPYFFPTGL